MLVYLLAPIYIALNIYFGARIYYYLSNLYIGFTFWQIPSILILLYGIIVISPLLGYLIIKPRWIHRFFKILGNIYFSCLLYGFIFVGIFDIVSIILKKAKIITEVKGILSVKYMGSLCLIFIIISLIYSYYKAFKINVKRYNIEVSKEANKDLKIAFIADLHLGYSFGEKMVKKTVDLINKNEVDLVCIGGDIFDNEFDAVKNVNNIEKHFREIKSTYGSFGVFGNHDVYEPLLGGFSLKNDSWNFHDNRMEKFMENSNIKMIDDKVELIDNWFYLIGRKDIDRTRAIKDTRLNIEELLGDLDKNKVAILIDHQPKDLKKIAQYSVDLDLSGHTHNGQSFPGNLIIKLFWENSYGLKKIKNMTSIVTSGIGIWGPSIRMGTKSEICIIDIEINHKIQTEKK